jgi:hypothetical protein
MISALVLAAAVTLLPVPLQTPCSISDCVLYQQTLVDLQAGKPAQLGWGTYSDELSAHVIQWEVQVLRFPPTAEAVPVFAGVLNETTTPKLVFAFSKAGVYYARVRTCYTEVTPRDCSAWAVTYDPTQTDPTKFPRGFIFNIKLAPATGVGVP